MIHAWTELTKACKTLETLCGWPASQWWGADHVAVSMRHNAAGSFGWSARAGKLAGLSEAFAKRRQGKDDKLGTDDGSDEAFLEQAKLRAQRLYEVIHLAKTAMLRNPMKRSWTPSSRPEGLQGHALLR